MEGACAGVPDGACDRREHELKSSDFRESGRSFVENGVEFVEVCAADSDFNYNSTILRLVDEGARFQPVSNRKYLFSTFCGVPLVFRLKIIGKLVSPVDGASGVLLAASRVHVRFLDVQVGVSFEILGDSLGGAFVGCARGSATFSGCAFSGAVFGAKTAVGAFVGLSTNGTL